MRCGSELTERCDAVTQTPSGNGSSTRSPDYSVAATLLDREVQNSPLFRANVELIGQGVIESITATGVDVALRVWVNMLSADRLTTRAYLSAMSYATPQIRPENRRALALLDEWMSAPDDLGEDWWAEFEKELGEHRLAFRYR